MILDVKMSDRILKALIESQKRRTGRLITFLFIAIVCSCSRIDKESSKHEDPVLEKIQKTESDEIPVTQVEDLSELKLKLPLGDYYYTIKISGIEFEEVNNAYIHKVDPYSKADSLSGLRLTVTYAMINPYDKEMIDVPIPWHFHISSEDELFGNGGTLTYDKKFRNATSTILHNGKEVKQRYGSKLDLSAKEVKEFSVRIDVPFLSGVQKVVFWEFDDRTNTNDMVWGNKIKIDFTSVGFEIDVKSKSILSQLRMQRWNHTEQIVQKIIGVARK
jgi:hypothetical protein